MGGVFDGPLGRGAESMCRIVLAGSVVAAGIAAARNQTV